LSPRLPRPRPNRPTSPNLLPTSSNAHSIPFVGLTGGIGAGKSTALAALERLGAAILSTDQVVHDLYDNEEVRDVVRERFGEEVAPGGVIDRSALATRAFETVEQREWLEQLLWPRVGAQMVAWREGLEQLSPRPRVAVVEVPLLFESGMESAFDATIAVVADEAIRSRRASARDHKALDERSARQLSQKEKSGRATYVVVNDGTVEELERELSAVLDNLQR
jgi:dephospho-CoA kinase